DPNAEMGPAATFICAGVLALIALGTLVSGLHPSWRDTATWQGLTSRSAFGSAAFSIGLLIMGAGMAVRAILDQHGPFAGPALLLFCTGGGLAVLGPAYDLIRNMKKR